MIMIDSLSNELRALGTIDRKAWYVSSSVSLILPLSFSRSYQTNVTAREQFRARASERMLHYPAWESRRLLHMTRIYAHFQSCRLYMSITTYDVNLLIYSVCMVHQLYLLLTVKIALPQIAWFAYITRTPEAVVCTYIKGYITGIVLRQEVILWSVHSVNRRQLHTNNSIGRRRRYWCLFIVRYKFRTVSTLLYLFFPPS